MIRLNCSTCDFHSYIIEREALKFCPLVIRDYTARYAWNVLYISKSKKSKNNLEPSGNIKRRVYFE